jgi:hypothetical protein
MRHKPAMKSIVAVAIVAAVVFGVVSSGETAVRGAERESTATDASAGAAASPSTGNAADVAPEFPPLGSATAVRGVLESVDFIHRTGHFRTIVSDKATGELRRFTMPPYAIMTYRGAEADLREVPLGTEFEFLLLPDAGGELTRLVGTRHGGEADDANPQKAEQQQKFVEFTTARGLAGWVDHTAGKRVTVTFFSGDPVGFDANWNGAFAVGQGVTVCVANDELRTWQPTSCGERGTIVEHEAVPVEGYGSSGRRVVIEVGNMLEGFRRGRIVRIFGGGWKVRNQTFMECLINYGYSHRPPPDFRECLAKHYPEQFPYRTDFGNLHLPWFQAAEGTQPPMHSEHVMVGDLTAFDPATEAGEFQVEGTGERVRFTMFNSGARTPAIRYRADNMESRGRVVELPLGLRYRFHMYQDAAGVFNRCSYLSDEYSYSALNSLNYQIQRLDLEKGECEVTWQPLPVANYQKDIETPPPYGRSLLRLTTSTRVWKNQVAAAGADRKAEKLKFEQQKAERRQSDKQINSETSNPEKLNAEKLAAARLQIEQLKADLKTGKVTEAEFKKRKAELVAGAQRSAEKLPADKPSKEQLKGGVLKSSGATTDDSNGIAFKPTDLKVGDLIKFNVASELPGRLSHCTDVWITEIPAGRAKPSK